MRSDASAQAAPSGEQGWRQSPHTRAGRWSVTLTAIFVVLFLINAFVLMRLPAQTPETWWHVLLPFYGIAMLACGLGAAILSLLAPDPAARALVAGLAPAAAGAVGTGHDAR